MITEIMFGLLLAFMLVCLILSIYFENVPIASFTIVLCLLLSLTVFPATGGIIYPIGTNLTSTVNGNTTNTVATDINGTYTSYEIGTVFIIIAFFLISQIVSFRGFKKRRAEEDNDK